MEVAGRSLRTDKSCYYLVDYIWTCGKYITTDPEEDMEIIATDMSEERKILSHLGATKQRKFWGCGWHHMVVERS